MSLTPIQDKIILNEPFMYAALPIELMCGFVLKEPKLRKDTSRQWSSALQVWRDGKLVKQFRFSIWDDYDRADSVRRALEYANGHVIQC